MEWQWISNVSEVALFGKKNITQLYQIQRYVTFCSLFSTMSKDEVLVEAIFQGYGYATALPLVSLASSLVVTSVCLTSSFSDPDSGAGFLGGADIPRMVLVGAQILSDLRTVCLCLLVSYLSFVVTRERSLPNIFKRHLIYFIVPFLVFFSIVRPEFISLGMAVDIINQALSLWRVRTAVQRLSRTFSIATPNR